MYIRLREPRESVGRLTFLRPRPACNRVCPTVCTTSKVTRVRFGSGQARIWDLQKCVCGMGAQWRRCECAVQVAIEQRELQMYDYHHRIRPVPGLHAQNSRLLTTPVHCSPGFPCCLLPVLVCNWRQHWQDVELLKCPLDQQFCTEVL